jgi:hypothetical protein
MLRIQKELLALTARLRSALLDITADASNKLTVLARE